MPFTIDDFGFYEKQERRFEPIIGQNVEYNRALALFRRIRARFPRSITSPSNPLDIQPMPIDISLGEAKKEG